MSVRRSDLSRELVFVVGTFVGMTAASLGFVVLILAMSIGTRRGTAFLTTDQKTIVFALGLTIVVVALLARLYRVRLPFENTERVKRVTGYAIPIGFAVALFGLSAQTNVSAPFLTTPDQKFVLFLIAYALIGAGFLILRGTARRVGW